MENYTQEADEILAECRQLLSEATKEMESLREENQRLHEEVIRLSELTPALPVPVETGQEEYVMVWYQEWLAIQNSLSWRITKPLRMIKKLWRSLRVYGLRMTLKKIFDKCKS